MSKTVGLEQQQKLEGCYLMQTYGRKPVEFVRGEGMWLFDETGKAYLDFLSGIGACSLGHCHPAVVDAIQTQASQLIHASNYFFIEHRGELACKLSQLLECNDPDALGNTGLSWRTFFANSGAEANEGAIKLARRWGHEHRGGATTIVTAQHSFHGRTLATLFATGQPSKQEAFLPEVPGFIHVPLNDIAALERALNGAAGNGVVAVMLECIQGEAGVWPCTQEYLQAARTLTRENDMLLILDEVQTGIYRTGKPFAFQNYRIVPDIVTIAKGIGDGFPVAAFCATNDIALELCPGDHGSTFGGSPLAVAAALATLDTLEEQHIEQNAQQVGAYLAAGLETLPHVIEVRGMGLMRGVSLDETCAARVVDAGLEAGLVLNAPAADILRFLPPLICSKADVDMLLAKLRTLLETVVLLEG